MKLTKKTAVKLSDHTHITHLKKWIQAFCSIQQPILKAIKRECSSSFIVRFRAHSSTGIFC